MRQNPKWARITGLVIHILIGCLLIFAGGFKILSTPTPEVIEEFKKINLVDEIKLIGVGELVAGLLLIIPVTMSLGTLVTSGFWGGVICIHMSQHDGYIVWSVFLLLTWVGAYLRNPATLASFFQSTSASAVSSDA